MPPGPVFNWLAVAHSALVILDHALQFRAAQVTRVRVSQSRQRARGNDRVGVYKSGQGEKEIVKEQVTPIADEPSSGPTHVLPSSLLHANDAWLRQLQMAATPQTPPPEPVSEHQHTNVASTLLGPCSTITPTAAHIAEPFTRVADVNLSRLDASLSQHAPILESDALPGDVLLSPSLESTRHLQSSKVPSSRIGRLFHYGGIYSSHSYLLAQDYRCSFLASRPCGIPRIWRSF